jgi:hypothetical protein
MASGLYSSQHDWQNEFTAHLSADLGSSDTDVFLDTIPTPTEGCLVIDPDTPASTEIILYTSKTSSKVTVPSVANGRGYDSTTATTHLSGTKVIMAPIADDFRYIRTVATTTPQGWTPLASGPNTVVANGNRSYTLTFNSTDYTSTVSAGMRLKTTRTSAAPTQCTSLNGTTQYYSKAAPSGMTFTNNFVVSAWVKLSSYSGSDQTIVSRYNGTSGFALYINGTTSGSVSLAGWNGGSANFAFVNSYQSIPLNKWVHITAQLDMTVTTNSATTNYVMIDGVDVPAVVTRGGTNPTALVQAGNLEIGARNAGTAPFNGKIAQAAIYSAKVTQATILASMNQTLAGTETSLISAYSFNNSINDLNANANNLTANGSAVATNADSPFGGQADGTISSTLDYAEVVSVSFSTNTTVTVRTTDVNTIPTSGGVSAVSYSSNANPYGFPGISNIIGEALLQSTTTTTSTSATAVNGLSATVRVPTGARQLEVGVMIAYIQGSTTTNVQIELWDGTVGSGTRLGQFPVSINAVNSVSPINAVIPLKGVSGTKTYNVAFFTNSGTVAIGASVTFPSILTIKLS